MECSPSTRIPHHHKDGWTVTNQAVQRPPSCSTVPLDKNLQTCCPPSLFRMSSIVSEIRHVLAPLPNGQSNCSSLPQARRCACCLAKSSSSSASCTALHCVYVQYMPQYLEQRSRSHGYAALNFGLLLKGRVQTSKLMPSRSRPGRLLLDVQANTLPHISNTRNRQSGWSESTVLGALPGAHLGKVIQTDRPGPIYKSPEIRKPNLSGQASSYTKSIDPPLP